MDMKHFGADVSEAMSPARGNNKRLSGSQDDMLFVDPHLGLASDDGKHFLDRVPMCRGANRWFDPLFEYAKLSCAVASRDMHSGLYPRPPFFLRLIVMRNRLHAFASIPWSVEIRRQDTTSC
jgi:hypothetical protein